MSYPAIAPSSKRCDKFRNGNEGGRQSKNGKGNRVRRHLIAKKAVQSVEDELSMKACVLIQTHHRVSTIDAIERREPGRV